MNESQVTESYASELLTVPEAARLLRISRNLAYELVARKEIPASRLGRVMRVPRHGLAAWLNAQAGGHQEAVRDDHSGAVRHAKV